MQTETTKLIIHTGAGPDAAREEAKRGGPKKARASKVKAGEVVVWGLVQENEADGLGEKAKERTADAGRKARERSARRERAAALRRARIGKFLSSRPRSEEGRAAPCSGAARQAKSPMCLEGIAAVKDTDFSLPLAAESAKGRVSQRAKRSRGRFKNRRRSAKPRLTFGERLLRNSAIACALLLALLAARNIDTPWTRAAVEGVERALTMKIDLDESLGSLSFVRDLMPESMLVFFDLSGKSELAQPVEGTLEKRFDEQQPWVEFACEPDAEVMAAEAGTVVATTQLSGGGWGVMIEHDNGLESVCAYLLEPSVHAGERVERGQGIARSEAGRVYFEVRREGEIIDPAPLIGA